MRCPECAVSLATKAKSCDCGWTVSKVVTKADRQHYGPCKISPCGVQFDGNDGLCGYHRALQRDSLVAWRESQHDWRDGVFAQFRREHEGDIWGSLIESSRSIQSTGEKRELISQLKRMMPNFCVLPYDPREREAA